jgi:phosphoribosylglycinamide formyltransferase-1
LTDAPRKIKTAILISGRGNNMSALIQAAHAKDFPAEIVLVISNEPEAKGLERAKSVGIPTLVVASKAYPDRYIFEEAIDSALRRSNVELVCLAGFMKILSGALLRQWPGRVLNIHPSLLPKFRGLHTHEQALVAGAKLHGCTVHLVTEELDAGPIIAQASVPVLSNDTPETLADRVMAEEVRLYPKALARVATNLQKGRPAV